jgi:transcriptional regulatory protein RtcR
LTTIPSPPRSVNSCHHPRKQRQQGLLEELERRGPACQEDLVTQVLGPDRAASMDLFDRVQLAAVLDVCRRSRLLSDAGRTLFAVSRLGKSQPNDADRLRKYLARFALTWQQASFKPNRNL